MSAPGVWWHTNTTRLFDPFTPAPTLRDLVRHALVDQGLAEHIPEPGRVLDIGGSGLQARLLARRGCQVTLVTPAPELRDAAVAALEREDSRTRQRVRVVLGDSPQAIEQLGGGWDLICWHDRKAAVGEPLLRALVQLTAPNGMLSLLLDNRAAHVLRPAFQGRWGDALALLEAGPEAGTATTPLELAELAEEFGAPVRQWYGVGVLVEHLGPTRPGAAQEEVVRLEWELGRRDPYRACARQLHLICQRVRTENRVPEQGEVPAQQERGSQDRGARSASPSAFDGLWDGWRVVLPDEASSPLREGWSVAP
ncbi:hypothetical protein GCM10012275_16490 [Longimycelium tulufanense]|uniref:Methyltransferase domain-containing protein n=1 Tax=Longimycelium tulufanense TaxID=907463 RepID=A0A8J3FT52_9PSEU|nr:hypothetical protein [Longimycelium tulufanense]GGM46181.1 hypothetical protein GCM10012275_16490 [Longimycelium tulufanense]